jgi:hypothetical protein
MSEQEGYLNSILPDTAANLSKTNISKTHRSLHSMDFEPFHVEETSTPGMTIDVHGARFTKNGVYTEFSLDGSLDVTTTASGTFTAPSANPKIDLLYYDMGTDALGITAGAENASPVQPTMPSPVDKIPIALIYHRVGSTSIKNTDDSTNSYIMGRNIRPFLNIGLDKLGAALDGQGNELSDVLTKNIANKKIVVAASGSSYDIDFSAADVYDITLDQNCTFTFSGETASSNHGAVIVYLRSVTYTPTLPSSIDWRGGTAPSLTASGLDILIFTTLDSGTIHHGADYSLDSK